MNRRDFLRLAGLAAGAVAFNGLPIPESPALAEALGEVELQVGDLFTIAGYYAVNPITLKTTEHPQFFVVTAVHENTVEIVPQYHDVGLIRSELVQALGVPPPGHPQRIEARQG